MQEHPMHFSLSRYRVNNHKRYFWIWLQSQLHVPDMIWVLKMKRKICTLTTLVLLSWNRTLFACNLLSEYQIKTNSISWKETIILHFSYKIWYWTCSYTPRFSIQRELQSWPIIIDLLLIFVRTVWIIMLQSRLIFHLSSLDTKYIRNFLLKYGWLPFPRSGTPLC